MLVYPQKICMQIEFVNGISNLRNYIVAFVNWYKTNGIYFNIYKY